MFLDQIVFQNQGFQLRIRHNIFKPGYLRYHLFNLWSAVNFLTEIRLYSAAQANRLADINDIVLCVVHQIHAGLLRQFFQLFFDYKHVAFSPSNTAGTMFP